MQTILSSIWTPDTDLIFYEENYYTINASCMHFDCPLIIIV